MTFFSKSIYYTKPKKSSIFTLGQRQTKATGKIRQAKSKYLCLCNRLVVVYCRPLSPRTNRVTGCPCYAAMSLGILSSSSMVSRRQTFRPSPHFHLWICPCPSIQVSRWRSTNPVRTKEINFFFHNHHQLLDLHSNMAGVSDSYIIHEEVGTNRADLTRTEFSQVIYKDFIRKILYSPIFFESKLFHTGFEKFQRV